MKNGIDISNADCFDIVVDGRVAFRAQPSPNGGLVFGDPEGMSTWAPTFQVSHQYDIAKTCLRSLLVTEAGDTADIAMRRVNGTATAPTGVIAGEWTGDLYWHPYDGNNTMVNGPLYGAAWGEGRYAKFVSDGGNGPYALTVDLMGEDDAAVFVVPAGAKKRPMSALKVKGVDYSISINGTAVSLTWLSGKAPAAGQDVWVMVRYNVAMTNPFYGRQGYVRAQSLETPTQEGRGAALILAATRKGEVVARPRAWVDGDSGNFVVASKAVYEADPQHNTYPDTQNLGSPSTGGYLAGAPSGVHPMTTTGRGALTVLSSGKDVESAVALRRWDDLTRGFDFDLDHTTGELRICSVTADVKTPVLTIGPSGIATPPKPAFKATLTADLPNYTGNGNVSIVCGTEVYDTLGNYNGTTGTFTAPVAGHYRLGMNAFLTGLDAQHTSMDCRIVCTGGVLRGPVANAVGSANAAGNCTIGFTSTVYMNAGDTAYPQVSVDNGQRVVGVSSAAGMTRFEGELIC